MQSRALAWLVSLTLATSCVPLLRLMTYPNTSGYLALRAGIVSLTFGLAVWAFRAATPMAAICGTMICLLLTAYTETIRGWPELHSALTPLLALFVFTFVSGKLGRARKQSNGIAAPLFAPDLAEEKRGRSAAQVVANLGVAGLIAPAAFFEILDRLATSSAAVIGPSHFLAPAMLLAALAEATADTVSSEIGSAFAGQPILLTTFKPVAPGTDGAISLLGTFAGLAAATFVVLAGLAAMPLDLRHALAALLGAAAGLFFDSLLGATLERKGWLGNDWVNFFSTLFAALTAAVSLSTIN